MPRPSSTVADLRVLSAAAELARCVHAMRCAAFALQEPSWADLSVGTKQMFVEHSHALLMRLAPIVERPKMTLQFTSRDRLRIFERRLETQEHGDSADGQQGEGCERESGSVVAATPTVSPAPQPNLSMAITDESAAGSEPADALSMLAVADATGAPTADEVERCFYGCGQFVDARFWPYCSSACARLAENEG